MLANNQNQVKVVFKRWYLVDTMAGKDVRLVLEFNTGDYTFTKVYACSGSKGNDIKDYVLSDIVNKEVQLKLEPAQNQSNYIVINLEHFVKNNNLKRKQPKVSQKDILAMFM